MQCYFGLKREGGPMRLRFHVTDGNTFDRCGLLEYISQHIECFA